MRKKNITVNISQLDIHVKTKAVLENMNIMTLNELTNLTGVMFDLFHEDPEVEKDVDYLIAHSDEIFDSFDSSYADDFVKKDLDYDDFVKKGFDYDVIEKLAADYHFVISQIGTWFGITKQRVSQLLDKRSKRHYEKWTGKELLNRETEIILSVIQNKQLSYTDDLCRCLFFNNMRDDFAVLFVYDKEIKCFFLNDLPSALRQEIVDSNYHRYIEKEILGGNDGVVKSVLKKSYFFPKDMDAFRMIANKRNMTLREYAMYCTGFPLGDKRQITDEQIIQFLNDKVVDGEVYISSDYDNHWIRGLASRNGFLLKDFVEFYGFKMNENSIQYSDEATKKRHLESLQKYIVKDNIVYLSPSCSLYRTLVAYANNHHITVDKYINELGLIRKKIRPTSADSEEEDMRVREISKDDSFAKKVFSIYPLVGSFIPKESTRNQLNTLTKNYIDKILHNPRSKLSIEAKMRISLALVNYAKDWEPNDNSKFWEYISLQFGYRDYDGKVIQILQESLEDSMRFSRRLFVVGTSGRAFKETTVIHAFSPKDSWFAVYDFLFDFYKTNLNWNPVKEDPLYTVMVKSLQTKLKGSDDEEVELAISSHVYLFRAGIKKLILLRPKYTAKLFENMIFKIHSMINSKNEAVRSYEAQLGEEWFQKKILAISDSKRKKKFGTGRQRDIAIDYSRIKPKYELYNETEIRLSLPDIRLNNENITTASLILLYDGFEVINNRIGWYGNELGKTLIGFSVPLPLFPEKQVPQNIQVKIICDGKIIYDSEESLNRTFWLFSGTGEVRPEQVRKDSYTFVVPSSVKLNTENVEVSEIDGFKHEGLKAFFLELQEGYFIQSGQDLLILDNDHRSEIRIIPPSESSDLPKFYEDGEERKFACRNSKINIIIGNKDYCNRFLIRINNEKIDLSHDCVSFDELSFSLDLSGYADECKFEVIDLIHEKMYFQEHFILVDYGKCSFDKDFYYSDEDYDRAKLEVVFDDFEEIIEFSKEDDDIVIPYKNGELHIPVPKIVISENTGEWLNNAVPIWYFDRIPHNSMLQIDNRTTAKIDFTIGNNAISPEDSRIVTIGSIIHSMVHEENDELVTVRMHVSGRKTDKHYQICQISYQERFSREVEFWWQDQRLFWNHGGLFIGKKDRKFTLALSSKGDRYAFPLDQGTDFIQLPSDFPFDNYDFEISVLTGGLFNSVKKVIAKGNCVVGDQNQLRFKDKVIIIDSITDENMEDMGHIPIKECYIDHIEFIDMEETSEGYCPIYEGILYTRGYKGERYEFSFSRHVHERGFVKMMVNPVRIVYVGNSTLCITDSEGDGLYYYYSYQRDVNKKIYEITDHEYNDYNKKKYSNADLYSYRLGRK